ncbi:MAG: tetratricopeptide repeat protein [Akkermansia sp.]
MVQADHSRGAQPDAGHGIAGHAASWNGSDAELAQMASSVDKQVEWMNPRKRGIPCVALAVEMDRRGMLKVEPMLRPLEKKLAASSSMAAEDHTRLLGVSLNWAREFARRKHDAVAEKLYEVILKNTPEDQVSIRLACLEPLIHYAYDQARFERFSALCKQAPPVMRSMLKKPEDVKSMVKIPRFRILCRTRLRGAPAHRKRHCPGTAHKFRLTANPDMGRIILNELKMPLNTRRKYSQEELKTMADQLEAALICFRAAETEMDCTPETMLALARVRMQMGDLREASRLLSRAEGAAMTLGVDAPRILSGSSLSQDIASMRSQLEKYSQAEALVKRAYEDVNVAAAFLKARDYDQAVKYLEQAMKVARENTTFVQALQPVILNLQAEISAGREQWPLSEAQYGKLVEEWDAR